MKIYKRKKNGSYYVRFSCRKKQYRVSLRTEDKDEAQKTAAAVMERVTNGQPRVTLTVGDLVEDYRTDLKNRGKLTPTADVQTYFWAHFCYNALPASELTAGDIDNELSEAARDEDWSNATFNRYLGVLSAAYNFGIRYEKVSKNPAKLVKRREEIPRDRWLTTDEINACKAWMIMEEIHYNDRLAFYLAVTTGLRAGELLSLEWDDVDVGKGTLTVRAKNTKSKRARTIPLTKSVHNQMRELYPEGTRAYPVFPKTYGYEKLRELAGKLSGILQKDFKWHDLRHTFAVHSVRNGMDLMTVSKLLGHKSTKVTERYANFAPSYDYVRNFQPDF